VEGCQALDGLRQTMYGIIGRGASAASEENKEALLKYCKGLKFVIEKTGVVEIEESIDWIDSVNGSIAKKPDLNMEEAAVLFSIACLDSQLAVNALEIDFDPLRAWKKFQSAAGYFNKAVERFYFHDPDCDLSDFCCNALSLSMLVNAQIAFHRAAEAKNLSAEILAKSCMGINQRIVALEKAISDPSSATASIAKLLKGTCRVLSDYYTAKAYELQAKSERPSLGERLRRAYDGQIICIRLTRDLNSQTMHSPTEFTNDMRSAIEILSRSLDELRTEIEGIASAMYETMMENPPRIDPEPKVKVADISAELAGMIDHKITRTFGALTSPQSRN